jgi:uncharacterized protein YeaO (DUF488 family)
MTLRLKRAYDPPTPDDGARYLVDRLWPRGLTAERLRLAAWRKELAPSEEVRRAYCHDPAKFAAFRTAYRRELQLRPEPIAALRREIAAGSVTLVFGAKDVAHSNAAVLAEFLTEETTAPPRASHRVTAGLSSTSERTGATARRSSRPKAAPVRGSGARAAGVGPPAQGRRPPAPVADGRSEALVPTTGAVCRQGGG